MTVKNYCRTVEDTKGERSDVEVRPEPDKDNNY